MKKTFVYLFAVSFCLSFVFFLNVNRVYAVSNLYIRVSRSYVLPGESYILYVLSSKSPLAGYTGLLDVKVTNCSADNPTVCTTTTGPWGDYYVENGSVLIDLSPDFQPAIFKARYRPRDSSWGWSNEIQVNVGTTYGLEDMRNYWVMPNEAVLFRGTNNINRTDFTTAIGYKSSQDICGDPGRTMYFMKDSDEGYWDPNYPWLARTSTKNLLWHLIPWQKQPGWHDEYLWARGHEEYQFNPADPFSLGANFTDKVAQKRYGSTDSRFPGYVLAPRWIGSGWGLGNTNTYSIASPDVSFCQIPKEPIKWTNAWVVHGDKTVLDFPGYKGPALRLKFYEGEAGFTNDRGKVVLREDWYFVKNVGLVKIDQKYFGPYAAGTYASRQPCQDDPDCLVNEYMVNPHVTLTKADYLPTPTPVPKPGDANGDGKVDGQDYIIWLNNYNQTTVNGASDGDFNQDEKVDGLDYIIWLNNYEI